LPFFPPQVSFKFLETKVEKVPSEVFLHVHLAKFLARGKKGSVISREARWIPTEQVEIE